ncbi:MAG: DinB family protein [Acidobacteriota bacterium]|nr:MAG: DinB family protein [Acidobacteriota bacterium]
MGNLSTDPSVSQILAEIDSVTQDTQESFGRLNARQLNWKPGEDQWSIAQCIDHLMTTNSHYFPVVDQVMRGEYRATVWQRLPLLPAIFGKMMLKALSSTQKFSAPKGFQPSQSEIDECIIERFVEHQSRLSEMIDSSRDKQLDRIIIASPVTGMITYTLLNAYRILALHERRHYLQARRVLEHQGFPR